MQTKKTYFVLALVVIVVGAAAFLAGRLVNGGPGALNFLSLGNGMQTMSFSLQMTPAPELPAAEPTASGTFLSRQDNTIKIQTIPMMAAGGSGGVAGGSVVVSSGDAGQVQSISPAGSDGPKIEVVITNETKIYRDATEMPAQPSTDSMAVQQKVVPGTLDELNTQTMVMVWGRKSGDRLIADVISFSNPIVIKK